MSINTSNMSDEELLRAQAAKQKEAQKLAYDLAHLRHDARQLEKEYIARQTAKLDAE